MNGPHWNYLTNGYVEAMGMKQFLFERSQPYCVWVPENAEKPVVYRGFDLCVVYNHALYAREPDGLAWSRLS